MKLTLGPVLYYWQKEVLIDFYQAMATQPVDIIYLGETVCSKRRAMRLDDWLEIAQELTARGKEVILSTLNLIESESDLMAVRRVCENGEYLVEANDMSAVQCMSEQELPFVTGPSVNVYNGRTLDFLARKQLSRWVLPIELGREQLGAIMNDSDLKPAIEVFGYGHMPLAYSARCFTARARNLAKDDCQFVCGNYPDGLPLTSQEDQRVFNLNGIQTQSGEKVNLVEEICSMPDLGVEAIRISPVSDLPELTSVIDQFDKARKGEQLQLENSADFCNGYWYSAPGMSSSQDLIASDARFLD